VIAVQYFFNTISTRGNKAKRMVKNGLPAIHPGEFPAEILGEMGIFQAEFERSIGVSPMRISLVIKGARPVTAELALLFGRAFNQRRHGALFLPKCVCYEQDKSVF